MRSYQETHLHPDSEARIKTCLAPSSSLARLRLRKMIDEINFLDKFYLKLVKQVRNKFSPYACRRHANSCATHLESNTTFREKTLFRKKGDLRTQIKRRPCTGQAPKPLEWEKCHLWPQVRRSSSTNWAQVMCTQFHNPHCSGSPITVTLTDEYPGACNNNPVHLDLSGIAFGKLAKHGAAPQLHFAGRTPIFFIKACNDNSNILFKVDKGSNPNFFAVVSKAVNGDGDLSMVEIKTGGRSTPWTPMKRMIGATWSVGIQPNIQRPPFSLRLTSSTRKSVIAQNVIPPGWHPRSVYRSNVNFPSLL
ncbi:Expansin-B15 [Capsicum annuum]|uniref:Expansin-B15 n=1 Tax=Capsicum annuum TaxID=4072 RepID=A0A2G3A7D6_CAPAN|nr:Expansin-B15 [Capsicum annuum]